MAIGMLQSMMGGLGGAGSLGTLFVRMTADASGLVNGFNQAEKTVTQSSSKMMKQVSGLAMAAGAALVALAAVGVREFARFDAAMTKSTAIMGDLSEEVVNEMAKTARAISRDSIKTADELAESYFFLASAGLSAEQSIGALAIVERFAVAGAFDMALATDLLTDAQSALGLTVKDTTQNMINMTRVSDVLVKANTLSNATVEQFSESLVNKAAAAMRSVNKDIEEGVAVLAAWADQGTKGRIAGERLNIVLMDLQRQALGNSEVFEKLGVTVFDAEGEMSNLADIVEDIENALAGLSTEQRRGRLEMMGFQEQSLSGVVQLLGMSDAIRRYERELRNAGGTTDEVARKQMQSFINQATVTWNRIKDLFLTIGAGLVPALTNLNIHLQKSIDWIRKTDEETGFINASMQTAVDVVKSFALGVMVIWTALKSLATLIAGAMLTALNVYTNGIQAVIKLTGIWWDTSKSVMEGLLDLGNTASRVGELFEAISNGNLLHAGWIARDLKKTYDKGFGDITKSMEKGVADSSKVITETTSRTADLVKGIVFESKEDIEKQWSGVVTFWDRLFGKGNEDANEAEKEIERVRKKTEQLKEEYDALTESVENSMQKMEGDSKHVNDLLDKMGAPRKGLGRQFRGFGDRGIQQAEELQMQEEAVQEGLRILQQLEDQELLLTEETQQRKLEAVEAYNEKLAELKEAEKELVLSSSTQMFEDLAGITEAFAGKQSGIYKTMFAASKAFAIAESVVKIQQGIASAASLPFPTNIAAIASVVAATANIVSTIQSVQMEFGGNRARGGTVSAGKAYMVGEEGREMFVPGTDGRVIPNNRLGGGEGGVRVVINNYTDAKPEVSEREENGERIIEVVLKKAKTEIASEIRDGRGEVNRAMQDTFGLRRGR